MIDYRSKTYKEILNRQLSRISDEVDKREGSLIMTALAPESWHLEGIYLDLENVQNNVYAPSAGGKYLDLIAESHGMIRKKAVASVKKGMFNTEIPIGKRFSTVAEGAASPLRYFVLQFVEVEGGKYVYQLECETPGEAGNSYVGQLLAIDYVQNLTEAQLAGIIISGADEESDESLRQRLIQKIQLPSTSGNKYDYYNWATEYAGVGAAKVYPLADGPGTVTVLIVSSTMRAAGLELINEVYEYIEELRPIGATVTVKSAIERGIDVSAKVRLKNGVSVADAQSDFAAAVDTFLKERALNVTYVSLAHVGNLLLDVSGVEDYNTLLLNGSPSNVVLGDQEVAILGNVVLEVL